MICLQIKNYYEVTFFIILFFCVIKIIHAFSLLSLCYAHNILLVLQNIGKLSYNNLIAVVQYNCRILAKMLTVLVTQFEYEPNYTTSSFACFHQLVNILLFAFNIHTYVKTNFFPYTLMNSNNKMTGLRRQREIRSYFGSNSTVLYFQKMNE